MTMFHVFSLLTQHYTGHNLIIFRRNELNFFADQYLMGITIILCQRSREQ